MPKCDCLNFCGDDERVRNNKALRCERYDRFNRYSNDSVDAMLLRTLNETLDATTLEMLTRAFEEKDLTKRYALIQQHLLNAAREKAAKRTTTPILAH